MRAPPTTVPIHPRAIARLRLTQAISDPNHCGYCGAHVRFLRAPLSVPGGWMCPVCAHERREQVADKTPITFQGERLLPETGLDFLVLSLGSGACSVCGEPQGLLGGCRCRREIARGRA